MTASLWRYAHLALALVSSVFLIVLAVTGVILAYDAIDEKRPNYEVENFQSINLAQVLPVLRENYFEVVEMKVDHNHFVSIDALDEEGNAIKGYIDPTTGKKIGEIKPKSSFIQSVTALHRSLFLKETGRTIVAVVSFLLLIIAITGLILVVKRQNGWRHFFTKTKKDFFSQYFHVVTGRWMLLPILAIAITGTAIFMTRLEALQGKEEVVKQNTSRTAKVQDLKDIKFFKETPLSEVQRVEFPFIPDDETEPFIVHLKNRSVTVNQVNGEIISESLKPYSAVLEELNMDWHTGRTSIVWSIILGLASLNILFFIYTGFVIMYKRTKTKIRNKYKAQEAEVVLLFGSENGSTLYFANQIHKQLLNNGEKSYLAEMNSYQVYERAQHIVVITSTYGLGEAPTNANNFLKLLDKYPQNNGVNISVIGFGSKAYDDFCGFAKTAHNKIKNYSWVKNQLPLFTVNDRSTEEFVKWAQSWSDFSGKSLATVPMVYSEKIPSLKSFEVIEKTVATEDNPTFKVVLQPTSKVKFQSGDLLAIYPANDQRERLYSVGKSNGNIQLVVKLFPGGLGSSFLHNLEIGNTLKGRIMTNAYFHLPKNASKIVMIANGTGIAPFLGMIQENTKCHEVKLYAGFRYDNMLAAEYRAFAHEQIKNKKLHSLELAFSREEHKQYVMDLIKRDEKYFADLLNEGGIVMICGALKMQKDVEMVLDELLQRLNGKPLEYYKQQILTDCY